MTYSDIPKVAISWLFFSAAILRKLDTREYLIKTPNIDNLSKEN